MPIPRKLTLSRLATIYKRQDKPSWGSDYVPSILAVRGEAPAISNAYATKSVRFGRFIHLLSGPEQSAFLLAAHHPGLVGIQEQRMLSPEPRCHPLTDMPGEVPARLKPFKGVIDVADRLGCLASLPKLKAPVPRMPGIKVDVIFPYIGDLLLAIKDSSGSARCVNWSIKANEAGFKRPIEKSKWNIAEPAENVLMRHEIERTYYADAGIHTHFVASSAFDTHLINNLRLLYRYAQEPLDICEDEHQDMESRFQSCLAAGLPLSELLPRLVRQGVDAVHVALTCFYQSIWQRRLRVDLFRPILVDRPLHPEERDVLDVYAKLFREGVVCI